MDRYVVICNWNSKGEAIINELHSEVVHDKRLVVVVTDKPLPKRIGTAWRGVFTVAGNPLQQEYLLQAMITKAYSAIILSDEESPNPDTTNFMLAASGCLELGSPSGGTASQPVDFLAIESRTAGTNSVGTTISVCPAASAAASSSATLASSPIAS